MKEIQLKPNGVALVDDNDFEMLKNRKWYLSKLGYAIGGSASNRVKSFIKMHRLIMGATNPKNKIDHIDGNRLNNQKNNLRFATIAQNTHNSKKRINTINIYKGTQFIKKLNLWQARCRMNGSDYYLGLYKTEISAAYAYNKKAIELSEFSQVNNLPYSLDFLEEILKTEYVTHFSDVQSKYKYLFFKKQSGRMKSGKWFIQFKHEGKRYYKGYFFEEEEAKKHLVSNYSKILNDAGTLK